VPAELRKLVGNREFRNFDAEVEFIACGLRTSRHLILERLAAFLEAIVSDFRSTIERKSDGISWAYPHAELNYSAPWRWSSSYDECESVLAAFERNEALYPLFALAEGGAILQTERGAVPLTKPDVSHSRRDSPEETPALSATFQLVDGRPAIVDFLCSSIPDVAVVADGKRGGEPEGSIFMLFHPFVFDSCRNTVFCSVEASLVFASSATAQDAATWSEERQRSFWDALVEQFVASCRQMAELAHASGELLTDAPTTEGTETARPTSAPTDGPQQGAPEYIVAPDAPPALPFLLAFQRDVQVDQFAIDVTTHIHKVRLPKNWPEKSWEELVGDEIDRLHGDEGDEAFTTTLKRSRGGRPMLRSKAENLLKIREGMTKQGYRFRDPTSGEEFLTRVFQLRDGYLEIGFSLYGLTSVLTEEGRKRIREEAERASSCLFPDMAQKVVARHRLLEDSHLMMQALMSCLAMAKANEFRIPAEALKVLLNIGNDPNWLGRIRGALYALANFKLRVKSFNLVPRYEAYGSYLNHYEYFGAGPGGSGQGTFLLNLNPKFFRFFQIFESQKVRLDNREIVQLDFTRRIKHDDLEGDVIYQTLSDAGDTFYSSAAGLSESQRNLTTFLTTQITRRKHPVSMIFGNASKRETDRLMASGLERLEPRLYEHDFCPLIPEGKRFEGALGRMKRFPESGWRLFGLRRSSRTPCLMTEMGLDLPSTRTPAQRRRAIASAIDDIGVVVEEYLEGLVAVYIEGEWMSIAAARQLPDPILRKSQWFPFLPQGWIHLRRRKWEHTQEERAKRGETPAAWKVTEDPGEAKRSHAAIREGRHISPSLSLSEPLWARLIKKRKELGLSQAQVGEIFGVSQRTVSLWEYGTEADASGRVRGKPISRELIPLVERWIEVGVKPSEEELHSRKTRQRGKRAPS